VPDIIGRLLAVKTNRLLLQVFWGQEHLEFKPEPERTTAPPHKTPRHWLRGRAGRPRRRRPMSQCASPTHGGAATGGRGRGRAENFETGLESGFFFDHPVPRTARGKGCTGKAGWGFISGFLSGATCERNPCREARDGPLWCQPGMAGGQRDDIPNDDPNIGHKGYVATTVVWYCPGLKPPSLAT
jgi:hypothetical protein